MNVDIPTEPKQASQKKIKSGFFAVDSNSWANACALGMNAAVAYLFLCRGTGGDNSTSSWSANAIEKYTNISRSRAKTAVESLLSNGLANRTKAGTRPQYKLRDGRTKLLDAKTIWVPNTIVTSTSSGETSPVERIRQTGDAFMLRLFVDLYQQQNLIEDGGIHRNTFYTTYRRSELGMYGQYRLLAFYRNDLSVCWNDTTSPHRREELTDDEIEQGKNAGIDIFKRFNVLETLGLVQCVPHLFESDSVDAEIIHALGESEQLETDIKNQPNAPRSACMTR